MAGIRTFGDAVKAAERAEEDYQEPITVNILDREVTIEYPGSGQAIYMTATIAGTDGDITQVGELVQFLYHLVEEEDAIFIKHSLLDRKSGFDGESVIELIEYLTEEWSSRPTRSLTGLSKSQPRTGPSSTGGARRKASTPSRSRSAAS